MSIIAISTAHISPYSPFAGEGEADLFSNYSVPTAQDRLTRAGLQPGDFFRFREGIFLVAWNRAGSATAKGDAVTAYINDASRLATLTAATNSVLTAAGAAFDVPNASGEPGLLGKLVFIITGTGTGQVRRILENTATTITVSKLIPSIQLSATDTSNPNVFDTAPAINDTIAVIGFDEVKKTGAVTDNVTGVAMGVYADDALGIFCVAGPCLAKIVGSTDAVTALGPIVPSATAGTFKGPTTAGETAAEARLSAGIAFSAYAGASALRLVFLTGKNILHACAPPLGVL